VRVEDADLLFAVLPDGATLRYTDFAPRARESQDIQLLAPGSAALADLLAETARHGALGAFELPASADPIERARTGCGDIPTACGRCVAKNAEDAIPPALCEVCPLRAGRLGVLGLGRIRDVREVRRWQAQSVELTFRVTYRDRHGRYDEWLRFGWDPMTGQPLPPIALASLAHARVLPLPPTARDLLAPALAEAERALQPRQEAAAVFFAQRDNAEYQRQRDDLLTTAERLRRESDQAPDEIERSLAMELTRLGDVFAVGVDAELESAVFITTPMAEVTVRGGSGSLTLHLDLGRDVVAPLACAHCGQFTQAAVLCRQGHLLCPRCAPARTTSAAATVSCPVCEGIPATPGSSASPRSRRGKARTEPDALTVTHLDAMTDETWRRFVGWYLEQQQCAIDRVEERESAPIWRLRAAGEPLIALAPRPGIDRALGDVEVRAAAASARGSALWLITSSPAAPEAHATAKQFGVRIIDRAEMARFLATASQAHTQQRIEAERDTLARIAAATALHTTLLDTFSALEHMLATAENADRVGSRSALVAAATRIEADCQTAERAFLAWDTILAEWIAAFGEREARDGSLAVLLTPSAFDTLGARIAHLREATLAAFASIAATPGDGEAGYAVWRKAVLEAFTARCESLRWRTQIITPAQWRDFSAAHDTQAAAQSESSATSARYAAGRAAKAYDDFAPRIRTGKAIARHG
jgi:hypothetical protein